MATAARRFWTPTIKSHWIATLQKSFAPGFTPKRTNFTPKHLLGFAPYAISQFLLGENIFPNTYSYVYISTPRQNAVVRFLNWIPLVLLVPVLLVTPPLTTLLCFPRKLFLWHNPFQTPTSIASYLYSILLLWPHKSYLSSTALSRPLLL